MSSTVPLRSKCYHSPVSTFQSRYSGKHQHGNILPSSNVLGLCGHFYIIVSDTMSGLPMASARNAQTIFPPPWVRKPRPCSQLWLSLFSVLTSRMSILISRLLKEYTQGFASRVDIRAGKFCAQRRLHRTISDDGLFSASVGPFNQDRSTAKELFWHVLFQPDVVLGSKYFQETLTQNSILRKHWLR